MTVQEARRLYLWATRNVYGGSARAVLAALEANGPGDRGEDRHLDHLTTKDPHRSER